MMKASPTEDDWIYYDSQQFLINLHSSLPIDDPLQTTLRDVFSHVLAKLIWYSGSAGGLHLLTNTIEGREGGIEVFETALLPLSPSDSIAIRTGRQARQALSSARAGETKLPEYLHRRVPDAARAQMLTETLNQRLLNCRPHAPLPQDARSWADLIGHLHDDESATEDRSIADGLRRVSRVLVIPLTKPTKKLPTGRLGAVLLWNDRVKDVEHEWQRRSRQLYLTARNMALFIERLLHSRYEAEEHTYLPSYRVPGERFVTVLFADIRNFTPTTEVLRNFGMGNLWWTFMRDFHRGMGDIVKREGGRVHSTAGDGFMSLFGEYAIEPRVGVDSALNAARAMCGVFDELRSAFMASDGMKSLFENQVEYIDFRLGVGINCGLARFDYFGAEGSRVYAPLGDHVNFAQRLETEANRFDEALKRRRSPILVGRPVWIRAGCPAEASVLTLQIKGKAHQYQAYECWPEGWAVPKYAAPI
jgi:class 3 adenylate cyclase